MKSSQLSWTTTNREKDTSGGQLDSERQSEDDSQRHTHTHMAERHLAEATGRQQKAIDEVTGESRRQAGCSAGCESCVLVFVGHGTCRS